MKKIFIGISIIIFLAVLYLGVFGIQFDKEREYIVSNTQQETYSYLTDISYYPQWYTGFIRHQLIRGDFQTEGSQFLLLVQDEGQKLEVIETFLQLDKPQIIVKEHQHDFYNLEIHIDIISQDEDSSHVVIKQEIYGTRFIERLLLPLYAGQVMNEHFNNIRKALDILDSRHQ